MRRVFASAIAVALTLLTPAAWAGPPYASDDPQPTDYKQFEIYLFASGSDARAGSEGTAGIDFNYGAAPNLQLTAVLPWAHEHPIDAGSSGGIGNIELAAKYRFLHQNQIGWDVAVFPRYFMSSRSSRVSDQHGAFLLPLWVQKDWDRWSTFGGGGCVFQKAEDSRNFCFTGWAVTHAFAPHLRMGVELVHRSTDTPGGHSSTGMGAGLAYDINDRYHFLASAGPTLRNAVETVRYSWYAALLLTL